MGAVPPPTLSQTCETSPFEKKNTILCVAVRVLLSITLENREEVHSKNCLYSILIC